MHLLSLGADEKALELYTTLKQAGISVLYDDRDERAGVKFAESDLIGIPYRVIVSKRSLEAGTVEVKKRTDKDATVIPFDRLITFLK